MAAPQEIAEVIFEVIEGGTNLGSPAQIIEFPSDNGQNVWKVVKETFTGSNGSGFNYWVVAFETLVGEVATAVSAGAAMLTMEVGAFGAACAPALGITTGWVLYNLAPSFWDSVAEQLIAAGETIGGKVVCFMDKYGRQTFSPNAIEIFKNALVNEGVFITGTQTQPSKDGIVLSSGFYKYQPPTTRTPIIASNQTIGYWAGDSDVYYTLILNPSNTISMLIATETRMHGVSVYSSETGSNEYFRLQASGTQTYNGKTYYTNVANINIWPFPGTAVNIPTVISPAGSSDIIKYMGYLLLYGDTISGDGEGLQDGATYPDMHPFPDLYPDWVPVEFPDIDGQQLPDRYPLQYPDALPDQEPYQEPSQNPDPDTDPDYYIDFITDPQNDPSRQYEDVPVPPPDPDPQPDPDPIDPTPDPNPDPDPPNPDPQPTPTPIIPVPPLPDTVSSSKLFTVYNPTHAQLDSLGGYLWDNSLIETLKKIWQNPLDGIISLIQVYATPTTGGSSNIILGYLDSGVSSAVVSDQFATIDCGSINLREKQKNVTDYTPYTSVQIYLPFIGITELDVNELMRGTINVKYIVDVYTGTCLAQVKITRDPDTPNGAILYTFSGNCSQQLPLTSGDATGILRSLIGAAGAGLSIATGGGIGLVAGASMVGNMLTHEMYHVGHSGNLSANSGIMGQKKPYLIINRQRPYTANNYNEYYGFPINKTVYLNNCSGFTRVKDIRLQTKATDPEREQILNLLQSGVIF